MDIEEVIFFIFLFLIVVVPVLGVTARVAFKPMVDAIIRLREGFADTSNGRVERHVLDLEHEVRQLRNELDRLSESEAFHRELLGSGALPPDDETAK